MGTPDATSRVVTEWMAENDLVIANWRNNPTFRRREQTSIIDLTMATNDMRPRISDWHVSDEESLSDHNYILFNICSDGRRTTRDKPKAKGWQSKMLDSRKLRDALHEMDNTGIITSAKTLSNKLDEICEKSMTKTNSSKKGKPAYWWIEEIAQLRK